MKFISKSILLYNVVVVTILTIVGFVGAQSIPELFSSVLFFPLAMYFWWILLPSTRHALPKLNPVAPAPLAKVTSRSKKKAAAGSEEAEPEELVPVDEPPDGKFDLNRRMFLRLIGSAGVSVFLLSIFTQKAEAAFFGSVPGPGTVGVKDSTGNLIDPAEKKPTDGYNITEIDDSIPAYYGYVNKDGAWYIVKEESSGAYRYAKGGSSFSTSWTGRAGLSYDYFNTVF